MSDVSGASSAQRIDRAPGDITEFPVRRSAEVGPQVLDEDDYIAEIFEAPETRAASAVAWAKTDRASPCYSHLLIDGGDQLSVDKQFEVGKPEFELLIQANRYQPRGKNDIVAFGLRGAKLRGVQKFENVERIPLQDARPDHKTFCCVIGYYFRSTGKFSAYTASTVPWHAYMEKKLRLNLLPTGCYVYKKGNHQPETRSRWVIPAFRLSDADGADSGPATILRSKRDLVFDLADEWEFDLENPPGDNIHCAYGTETFSSCGCQTIKGGLHDGLWADFQKTIKSLPDNARVDYMLITGAECSIAAGLIKAAKPADDPEVSRRLARLRTGSEGDEVKRLQAKLGETVTGYFGPSTKDKLIKVQRDNQIPADGIFSPATDTRLGWGVFSAGPAVQAAASEQTPSSPVAATTQPAAVQSPAPVASRDADEALVPVQTPAPVQAESSEPTKPPGVTLTPETVRQFAARDAKPEYLAILGGKGNEVLSRYGINENAKRLCHFMAQIAHECRGFAISEESLKYSAKRMIEIFGVGHHSAGITPSEAQRLVGHDEAFAERVYGLGNPKKAKDLGNTQPGDGYRYRGRGFMQLTGRSSYREIGQRIGMDLEADPDKAGSPEGALMAAVAEWDQKGCNKYADQDNIDIITKRINGGHIGLAERKELYAKAVRIWGKGDAATTRSIERRDRGQRTLEYGDLGPDVLHMKELLVRAGYGGFKMDEDFSRATHIAAVRFKMDVGLPGDGIVDPETWSALERAAGAAKRSGGRPEASPTRWPARMVWAFGFLLLLAAVAVIGLRVMQPSEVEPFRNWIEIGFAGFVVLASIVVMRLGGRIVRASPRAAVPEVDEGLRREVSTAG